MSYDEIAYRITWEVDHFTSFGLDWDVDLELVEYPGYDSSQIFSPKPFRHPDPILLQGYPPVVRHIDYPYMRIGWPVMSRRMYEVLLQVGSIAHRCIPIAVVDSRLPAHAWRDSRGKLLESVLIGDYVLLQLTEPQTVFDRNKSVFQPNPAFPDWLGDVDEYVFESSVGSLPPFFNLAGEFTRFFVSREAREALREAGIAGSAYVSLEGYARSGNDEVDVPVDIAAGNLP
jgi:hypothetical protein